MKVDKTAMALFSLDEDEEIESKPMAATIPKKTNKAAFFEDSSDEEESF